MWDARAAQVLWRTELGYLLTALTYSESMASVAANSFVDSTGYTGFNGVVFMWNAISGEELFRDQHLYPVNRCRSAMRKAQFSLSRVVAKRDGPSLRMPGPARRLLQRI